MASNSRFALVSFLLSFAAAIKDDNVNRVISVDELSSHGSKGGKDDGLIYLSVLGEVYDVTSGKEFYGEGSGYSYFAGRDGTASFFSGDFTDDAEQKSILEYDAKQIKSMAQWREFYEEHEDYSFVGVLNGEFYNSNGKPTQYLKDILNKMNEGSERKEL